MTNKIVVKIILYGLLAIVILMLGLLNKDSSEAYDFFKQNYNSIAKEEGYRELPHELKINLELSNGKIWRVKAISNKAFSIVILMTGFLIVAEIVTVLFFFLKKKKKTPG